MPRPIQWFRLHRGRVWHVYAGEFSPWASALCGQLAGVDVEDQAGRPPQGGKPCPECLAVASAIEETGIEALATWRARHYPLPGDDLVDAEILDGEDAYEQSDPSFAGIPLLVDDSLPDDLVELRTTAEAEE